MSELKPTNDVTEKNTEDLIDITDNVTLNAYLQPANGETPKGVILRISSGDKFDIGLSIGPYFGPKVLKHLTEDGEIC